MSEEMNRIMSHSSLYTYLPVGGVILLAFLVFAFGFKTAEEPKFESSKNVVAEDSKKKKHPKTKSKGEAKKTAAVSPSSSPSKSVAKTIPATKNVEMSEMMPATEKSSNKKQVAKQAKAAYRNEPKPADFDEGEWVQVVSPTLTKKDKKKSSEVAAAVVSVNASPVTKLSQKSNARKPVPLVLAPIVKVVPKEAKLSQEPVAVSQGNLVKKPTSSVAPWFLSSSVAPCSSTEDCSLSPWSLTSSEYPLIAPAGKAKEQQPIVEIVAETIKQEEKNNYKPETEPAGKPEMVVDAIEESNAAFSFVVPDPGGHHLNEEPTPLSQTPSESLFVAPLVASATEENQQHPNDELFATNETQNRKGTNKIQPEEEGTDCKQVINDAVEEPSFTSSFVAQVPEEGPFAVNQEAFAYEEQPATIWSPTTSESPLGAPSFEENRQQPIVNLPTSTETENKEEEQNTINSEALESSNKEVTFDEIEAFTPGSSTVVAQDLEACPVTSPLNDEKLAWVVNLMDSVLEEEQISSAAAWSLTSSGVSLIASAGEENRQQPVVDVISSETKNKEKNNNKLAALDVGNEEVAFHAVEESMVTFSAVDQVSEDNSSTSLITSPSHKMNQTEIHLPASAASPVVETVFTDREPQSTEESLVMNQEDLVFEGEPTPRTSSTPSESLLIASAVEESQQQPIFKSIAFSETSNNEEKNNINPEVLEAGNKEVSFDAVEEPVDRPAVAQDPGESHFTSPSDKKKNVENASSASFDSAVKAEAVEQESKLVDQVALVYEEEPTSAATLLSLTSSESPLITPAGEENTQQPTYDDIVASTETKNKEEKNNNNLEAVEEGNMEEAVDNMEVASSIVAQEPEDNHSNASLVVSPSCTKNLPLAVEENQQQPIVYIVTPADQNNIKSDVVEACNKEVEYDAASLVTSSEHKNNEVNPVDLVYDEVQTSFESPLIIAPSGEKNLQQPIVDVFTSAETKIKDEKNNNQELAVEAVGMEVTVDELPLTAAVVLDLKESPLTSPSDKKKSNTEKAALDIVAPHVETQATGDEVKSANEMVSVNQMALVYENDPTPWSQTSSESPFIIPPSEEHQQLPIVDMVTSTKAMNKEGEKNNNTPETVDASNNEVSFDTAIEELAAAVAKTHPVTYKMNNAEKTAPAVVAMTKDEEPKLTDERMAVNRVTLVFEEEPTTSAAAWSLTSPEVSLIVPPVEDNQLQPIVDVASTENKEKNNKLEASEASSKEAAVDAVEEPVDGAAVAQDHRVSPIISPSDKKNSNDKSFTAFDSAVNAEAAYEEPKLAKKPVALNEVTLEQEPNSWAQTLSESPLIAPAVEENQPQPIVDAVASKNSKDEKNNSKPEAEEGSSNEVAVYEVNDPIAAQDPEDEESGQQGKTSSKKKNKKKKARRQFWC